MKPCFRKKVISSRMLVIILLSFISLKLVGVKGFVSSIGRLCATRTSFRRGRKRLVSNFRMSLSSIYFNIVRFNLAKALGDVCVGTIRINQNTGADA